MSGSLVDRFKFFNVLVVFKTYGSSAALPKLSTSTDEPTKARRYCERFVVIVSCHVLKLTCRSEMNYSCSIAYLHYPKGLHEFPNVIQQGKN